MSTQVQFLGGPRDGETIRVSSPPPTQFRDYVSPVKDGEIQVVDYQLIYRSGSRHPYYLHPLLKLYGRR